MQSGVRFLFYSVWAVLMTALTYILGAASLKVLRRNSGRLIYWGLTVALSVALFAFGFQLLAVAFLSLVLLMGVFAELEELGLAFHVSAFFTLVINSLIWTGTFLFWMSMTGPKWSTTILTAVENMLKPLETYNPGLQLKYYDLMLQLPSIILMMWMAALYLAILLESRGLMRRDHSRDPLMPAGSAPESAPMRDQLKEFRVPDACVWIFILALLGKFGGFSNQAVEAVSANALNVCFTLFFFQGIAVVGRTLEKLRVGLIWQSLFMVLIVVYLFLFVSVLGLTDYWFDFRAKFAKGANKNEEFEREI